MQHVALVVGTVAVKVTAPGVGGALLQADPANTADVFVGGAYVTADATATGGIRLQPTVLLPISVDGNDPLWAISSAPGQVLRVLQGSDPVDFGTV